MCSHSDPDAADDTVELGSDPAIDDGVVLGYGAEQFRRPTVLGDRAVVRRGSIIYGAVTAGDDFATGHSVLVREDTTLGDDVLVGTRSTIDGRSTIGSRVSLQTGVYVPPETAIGDDVFVGPGAVMTNDRYPVRTETELDGPTVEDHVSIGANATVMPGVTLGTGSFVAAGAVVTADVPPDRLAIGAPAVSTALPDPLDGPNRLE